MAGYCWYDLDWYDGRDKKCGKYSGEPYCKAHRCEVGWKPGDTEPQCRERIYKQSKVCRHHQCFFCNKRILTSPEPNHKLTYWTCEDHLCAIPDCNQPRKRYHDELYCEQHACQFKHRPGSALIEPSPPCVYPKPADQAMCDRHRCTFTDEKDDTRCNNAIYPKKTGDNMTGTPEGVIYAYPTYCYDHLCVVKRCEQLRLPNRTVCAHHNLCFCGNEVVAVQIVASFCVNHKCTNESCTQAPIKNADVCYHHVPRVSRSLRRIQRYNALYRPKAQVNPTPEAEVKPTCGYLVAHKACGAELASNSHYCPRHTIE